MTAREYLMQISITKEQIRQRQELINELRLRAAGLTGQSDDGVRVKTSNPDGDRMAEAVANIVDLENELAEEIVKLSRMQADAARRISALRDSQAAHVLYDRYVRGCTWKYIEADMRISHMQTGRLLGRAFQAFEQEYGEELDLESPKRS